MTDVTDRMSSHECTKCGSYHAGWQVVFSTCPCCGTDVTLCAACFMEQVVGKPNDGGAVVYDGGSPVGVECVWHPFKPFVDGVNTFESIWVYAFVELADLDALNEITVETARASLRWYISQAGIAGDILAADLPRPPDADDVADYLREELDCIPDLGHRMSAKLFLLEALDAKRASAITTCWSDTFGYSMAGLAIGPSREFTAEQAEWAETLDEELDTDLHDAINDKAEEAEDFFRWL